MTSAARPITVDTVFALMGEPRHQRHKLWTPSLVLERLGISRYPAFTNADLKRSRRVLEQLWSHGKICKKTRLDHRFTLKEVAFTRLEDAPVSFYACCPACGSDQLVENGMAKPCRQCSGPVETTIRPYP